MGSAIRWVVDHGEGRVQETPLEAAARRYRLQIYETYRSNRSEYERRRVAWEDLQNRFVVTGSRREDEQALVEWLEQATYQSHSEVSGALPVAPQLGNIAARARERALREQTRRAGQPNANEVSGIPDGRRPIATSPHVDSSVGSTAPSRQVTSSIPADAAPLPAPPRVAAVDRSVSPASAAPDRLANRSVPWQAGPSDVPRDTLPGAVYPSRADRGVAPRERDITPPPRSAVMANGRDHAIGAPTDAKLTTPTSPSESAVNRVNVAELLSRASGYRVGLETVQSVLLDKDGLSERDLTRLVNELEALLQQRHALLLYDRLINPDDHERLVRSLEFPQTAVSQLGTSIAEARESLTARTDLGSAQRDLGLQELDSLSDRLSRMSRD